MTIRLTDTLDQAVDADGIVLPRPTIDLPDDDPSGSDPGDPADIDDLEEELLQAIDLLEGTVSFFRNIIEQRPDWADELPGLDDHLLDIDNYLENYYNQP
jgi:hypothetical protein